jgi:hypothetical protein
VNYVALLAVLAATSFVLPLLVQGCELLGLQRSTSVAVSLVLAAGWLALWVVRALWLASSPRTRVERRASRSRRTAPGAAATGVVDGAALRLVEAEEESRAGV